MRRGGAGSPGRRLHTWADPIDGPLRLIEQTAPKKDAGSQSPGVLWRAMACYGVLLRQVQQPERVWLRFVDGRPVSAITEQFLAWGCARLQETGVRVWLLIWDNASWHVANACGPGSVPGSVRTTATSSSTLRGCASSRAFCRSRAPGSTRLSRNGSMANVPSSSPLACSAPSRSLIASAPTSTAPMSRTSPFPTRRHDLALGSGGSSCLGGFALGLALNASLLGDRLGPLARLH